MPTPPDAAWRGFTRTLVGTALVFAVLVAGFIVVVDPYANVPFSPALDRAPVTTNQRFSYVSVARDGGFGAALFGTSTARMLRPEALQAAFGPVFANLAMNSATAWEQYRLFDLWRRSTPEPRMLMLALDGVWCHREGPVKRLTFRQFPEWMYDDNRWNDLLYLFNDKALEQAVRQLEQLLGRREPKYRRDGFGDFLPPAAQYDPDKVRRELYGHARPAANPPPLAPAASADIEDFPMLTLLEEILDRMPAQARTVLFFVPYHVQAQRSVASRMPECKRAVMDLVAGRVGTHLVDFMFPGRITTEDRNYWDRLHYDRPVADEIVKLLAAAVRDGRGEPGAVRYLAGATAAAAR